MATNYDAVIAEQLAKIPAATIASPADLGQLILLGLPTPAAGTDFAPVAVPTHSLWKVRAFGGRFATGAGVADRYFSMAYTDGKNLVLSGGESVAIQQANSGVDYHGKIGSGPVPAVLNAAQTAVAVNLADLILLPGYLIGFQTASIQPADTWTRGSLYIEQWSDQNRLLGWLRG